MQQRVLLYRRHRLFRQVKHYYQLFAIFVHRVSSHSEGCVPYQDGAFSSLSHFRVITLLRFRHAISFVLLRGGTSGVVELLQLKLRVFLNKVIKILRHRDHHMEAVECLFRFFPPLQAGKGYHSRFMMQIGHFPMHYRGHHRVMSTLRTTFGFREEGTHFSGFKGVISRARVFTIGGVYTILVFFRKRVLSQAKLFRRKVLGPTYLSAFTPIKLTFPIYGVVKWGATTTPKGARHPVTRCFRFSVRPFSSIHRFQGKCFSNGSSTKHTRVFPSPSDTPIYRTHLHTRVGQRVEHYFANSVGCTRVKGRSNVHVGVLWVFRMYIGSFRVFVPKGSVSHSVRFLSRRVDVLRDLFRFFPNGVTTMNARARDFSHRVCHIYPMGRHRFRFFRVSHQHRGFRFFRLYSFLPLFPCLP